MCPGRVFARFFDVKDMGAEGEKKRIAMAGATGAMEEDYRQGLAAHTAKHNKARQLAYTTFVVHVVPFISLYRLINLL